MTKLPVFINTPVRRFEDTEWFQWIELWRLYGPPSIFMPLPGDKCDVARSMGIEMAKGKLAIDYKIGGKSVIPEAPPEVTIQIDSDVMPRQPMRQMLGTIHGDFALGFDVITAPTVSNETLMSMVWTDAGEIPTGACSEVKKCAFGFVAFSPKFIEEVQPEGTEKFWPGTDKERLVPMYCHFAINEDDSTTFSKLVVDQGFRLGVDPRLFVTHRKAIELEPVIARWILSWNRAMNQSPRFALELMRGVEKWIEDGDTGNRNPTRKETPGIA